MTLGDIRTVLVGIDPHISHYFSVQEDKDYSYWEETQRLPLTSDQRHDEGWHFYVHRFTKDEFDPVARRMFEALDGNDRVTVSHTVDFDRDAMMIHHIFECEGY